jgi:hypothetical protein
MGVDSETLSDVMATTEVFHDDNDTLRKMMDG